MTSRHQKQNECRYVRQAMQSLGMEWEIVPRNEYVGGPDFLIRDGENAFGLEVHEIFKGKTTAKRGSRLKQRQSEVQQLINAIRDCFESLEEGLSLYVIFRDNPNDNQRDLVVEALSEMNLREREIGYQGNCTIEYDSESLKMFVTRLPDGWPRDRMSRPDWFSVADSGGWLEDGSGKISRAIKNKAKKIGVYKENVARELGLASFEDVDVRLLLIADHMWSYGKIEVCEEMSFDLNGFTAVYFFPFPEKPIILKTR